MYFPVSTYWTDQVETTSCSNYHRATLFCTTCVLCTPYFSLLNPSKLAMSCLRICLSLWWWSSGYAYPRRFRVLELSFRKTLKCHFCSSCYRACGTVWEVRGNVTSLSFSWLWWGSSGLSGPVSNLLSSLCDAYLRYLRESLRGLQLFRCDIWGLLWQGKRVILGSRVAPSPSSLLCAPFTLSLLNRHNSGEDLTGDLLRMAKTVCIGSSCPFSIPQLSGVFCRGWFPFWFCNSMGGTFITGLSVALMWTTPSLVIYMSYSYTVKALLLSSVLSKPTPEEGVSIKSSCWGRVGRRVKVQICVKGLKMWQFYIVDVTVLSEAQLSEAWVCVSMYFLLWCLHLVIHVWD